jgi:hypothetical protein
MSLTLAAALEHHCENSITALAKAELPMASDPAGHLASIGIPYATMGQTREATSDD